MSVCQFPVCRQDLPEKLSYAALRHNRPARVTSFRKARHASLGGAREGGRALERQTVTDDR